MIQNRGNNMSEELIRQCLGYPALHGGAIDECNVENEMSEGLIRELSRENDVTDELIQRVRADLEKIKTLRRQGPWQAGVVENTDERVKGVYVYLGNPSLFKITIAEWYIDQILADVSDEINLASFVARAPDYLDELLQTIDIMKDLIETQEQIIADAAQDDGFALGVTEGRRLERENRV